MGENSSMTDYDVRITARLATIDRILEFLLANSLSRHSDEQLKEVREMLKGETLNPLGALLDVETLQDISRQIDEQIDWLFDRVCADLAANRQHRR